VLGDHRQAIGLLHRNVEWLAGDLRRERFGLTSLPAVSSRAWLVRCLAELGVFSEATAHAEAAIRIAEGADHPNSLVHAYLSVGFLALRQRDLSRAIRVLERCLELCRVFTIPLWFSETAAALGCAYAYAGRVAEALPLLEQAEQRGPSTGMIGGHALLVCYWSEASLLAGRMQEAGHGAERALDLARDQKERGYHAWALWLLGEITAHQPPQEIEPAAHYYRQALALADALGMRPLVAHCHRGLGMLYAQLGTSEQSRIALSRAVALYRDMGMTFWLPQAEATLAQLETRPC